MPLEGKPETTVTPALTAWLRACVERDRKYAEWQKAAEEASRLSREAFGDTR